MASVTAAATGTTSTTRRNVSGMVATAVGSRATALRTPSTSAGPPTSVTSANSPASARPMRQTD